MTVRTHPTKSRYKIAHAIPLPRVLRAKDSAAAPKISMQKQYRKNAEKRKRKQIVTTTRAFLPSEPGRNILAFPLNLHLASIHILVDLHRAFPHVDVLLFTLLEYFRN